MRMKLGQLVNDLFLKVIFIETIVKGFFKLLELVECYKTCYSCPLRFVLCNSSGENVNI